MGPPELSVVVPIFNEEETLELLVERLHQALAVVEGGYELIFVDDGSNDRSVEIIRRLHEENPCVKLLRLSRNFGHQLAISCGLDFAVGRAVVCMDGDFHFPIPLSRLHPHGCKRHFSSIYKCMNDRPVSF